jgi:outer membrane protein insertion porin family
LKRIKLTYILAIVLLASACKQTKYVPQGKFLLKSNKVTISGDRLQSDEVSAIIRQKPNFKTLGFKTKLMVYNAFDSTSIAEKRDRKNEKLRIVNRKKRNKEMRINENRIAKAKKKEQSYYTKKIIPLKDTVNPRLFVREWLKYKYGEVPVVFDTLLYEKSLEQLSIFLRKKGYYYSTVCGEVVHKRNRKAIAHYQIETGKVYTIDSVYVLTTNNLVRNEYGKFIKKQGVNPLLNANFDADFLDDYRSVVARHMRDNALFGFSSSHIAFVADTNKATMHVTLGIEFTDRLVRHEVYRDSLIKVRHRTTLVRDVFFHIADTTRFDGNFKQTVDDMGLTLMEQQFLRTLDTLYYKEIKVPRTDSLDLKRFATFYYNGEAPIDPGLIELQNYLEKQNYYKEYYLERSYTRLLQLGLFQAIKPVIVEVPGTNLVDVHYYLVPAKKQSFGFEPRFTNSNGFLGVQSSVNYTNKNLFGGGERFTFSLGGGFESQPPIFDQTLDGEENPNAGRSFNTFEIGPSIKFDIPGLFPTKVTLLSKRKRPRTVISSAFNYQNRADFTREVIQMNYLWRFYGEKTQVFQAGLPFASIIKFVSIDKSQAFEERLNQLEDLFLINAYSNQFIWQDWKLTYEFNNKDRDNKKTKNQFYMNSTFDPAGNVLSLFKNIQDTTEYGQRTIFGVGYAQFLRVDNDFNFAQPLGKKSGVHLRLLAGGGVPYGNTTTSLPYDYSFFAGGANDNRGWRARQLGPGGYKYYLDTNRLGTQIGDIRIGGSAELRFSLGGSLRGALFFDAGNVWTLNEDINRPGSKFSSNWFREIALSGGVGIRYDLDFFIVRLDFGLPLTNPSLPDGARWIFQSRQAYYDEGIAVFGIDNYMNKMPKPFTPQIHFGIGYPF